MNDKSPLKSNKAFKRIILAVIVIVIIAPLIIYIVSNLKPNKTTYMVVMSDGIELATDVYLPKGDGPYPVILYRTPYNKKTDMGPLNLLDHNVAIVTQDNRGCHASDGTYSGFSMDGQDAYDTVKWMEEQSWFNGTYATYGNSARGITQYMQVPYLNDIQAQYIEVATPDLFYQGMFQGGAPRKMLVENWLQGIGHGDYYQTLFNDISAQGAFASANRIDSSQYSNVTWPAIHKGGWYDCFGQGTIDGFIGYQYNGGQGGKGNSKLIMGPWTHNLYNSRVGELTFPHNATYDPYSTDIFNAMFAEALLNTTQYGNYRDFPNVTYYVMGDTQVSSPLWNSWATSDIWPVPYTDHYYYLQNNGTLKTSVSETTRNYTYSYNPRDPVPTLGGANLYTDNRGAFDQRAVESGRNDIIVFDYPITEPLLITGRISASLYVTSDCVDTDFTVKLMDVYPDQSAYNIADGIIRMRYRNGMEQSEFMDATGETVYNALIDLWSSSYYFKEGHTLRISISSSNYPRFDVNPNTGATIRPVTDDTPYIIANNSIIVSPEYPSALILPIPTDMPNYVD